MGISQTQVFAASGGSSDQMGEDEALKECIYSDTSEQGSKSGESNGSGNSGTGREE